MSGQETGGLREQIIQVVRTHAIDSTRNDRAQDADYCLCGVLVEDWDEHWTDAALALVQPELDAKDAQIAEQQAEIERLTALGDYARNSVREQQQRAARAEQAEAERDRLRKELAEYRQANTSLQQINTLRTGERDRLRAALTELRDKHGRPRSDRHGSGCIHCAILWPCPTYKIAQAALGQGGQDGAT